MKYHKGPGKCITVAEDEYFETGILSDGFSLPFLEIDPVGLMCCKEWFVGDGPSFPAVRTKSFIRSSTGHDGGYALLRAGFEAHRHDEVRERFDLLLADWSLEDGMWRWRADWVYRGVRLGGGPAAKQKKRKVYEAP